MGRGSSLARGGGLLYGDSVPHRRNRLSSDLIAEHAEAMLSEDLGRINRALEAIHRFAGQDEARTEIALAWASRISRGPLGDAIKRLDQEKLAEALAGLAASERLRLDNRFDLLDQPLVAKTLADVWDQSCSQRIAANNTLAGLLARSEHPDLEQVIGEMVARTAKGPARQWDWFCNETASCLLEQDITRVSQIELALMEPASGRAQYALLDHGNGRPVLHRLKQKGVAECGEASGAFRRSFADPIRTGKAEVCPGCRARISERGLINIADRTIGMTESGLFSAKITHHDRPQDFEPEEAREMAREIQRKTRSWIARDLAADVFGFEEVSPSPLAEIGQELALFRRRDVLRAVLEDLLAERFMTPSSALDADAVSERLFDDFAAGVERLGQELYP